MKSKLKILSAFLAVLLFLGSVSGVAVFPVYAAEVTVERSIPENKTVTNGVYATPQERVANMDFYFSKNGYEIYADPVTGEVAYVEIANPENILFTNPYDVGSMTGTTITDELLSQIIITYSEKTSNAANKPVLNSYTAAAMRGQLSISQIRNGIRVSYTIGDLNKRRLVPRWVPQKSFEENILEPIAAALADDGGESSWDYQNFLAYYTIYGKSVAPDPKIYENWKKLYPVLANPDICIYVLSEVNENQLSMLQSMIKDYCSATYSFDQMDADHEATGYVEVREEKPVFKAALEYTITDDGLSVRLPCNSLQYNMATYTLESIQVLPYMGAGNTSFSGYNFYPDGSGSLFDFAQTVTVQAPVYGLDYAYHQISGATYQKSVRMPVYGSVATEVIHTYTDAQTGEEKSVSNFVKSVEKLKKEGATNIQTTTYQRGYVAIMEAGESLGTLTTTQLGSKAKYATLTPSFNPKPKDTYELDSSLSATGSNNEWTVVSERKYTGDIRILYRMLTDAERGSAKKITARAYGQDYLYYEASWLGMAEAYRDYLIQNGILTKLGSDVLTQDIPLYMEVFGAIETQTTIATIPVNVMTPLTTFEDIATMYQYLSGNGVQNVNFKMTGFANGGMYCTMPGDVQWESKVGGADGFRNLLNTAHEIEMDDENAVFGLYPDFDFAYSQTDSWFDDLDLKQDAVKTIDNRYSSKRIYSATQQTYVSYYQLAISPSRYSKFYTKLMNKLEDYELQSMSVSSLGYALNSDFDEKDPYNREDSKKFTKKALADISAQYSLMTDYGNAYSWLYVDHIINADVDSSRYSKASASVPFLGTVLHGYIQFAGPSLNQEGDPNYMILKSVENGAGMYFILSYQNTSELKEDAFLNSYYSIDYNIWKEDLVGYYKELNDLLYDVQNKVIIDHKFLNQNGGYQTVRMLAEDELLEKLRQECTTAADEARIRAEQAEIAQKAAIAEATVYIRGAKDTLEGLLEQMREQSKLLPAAYEAMLEAANLVKDRPARSMTVEEIQATVDDFYQATVNAYAAYNVMLYLYGQIQTVYGLLPEMVEVIRADVEGTDAAYRYTDAKRIMETLLADGGIIDEATALLQFADGQTYGQAIAQSFEQKMNPLFTNGNYTSITKYTFSQVSQASEYIPQDDAAEGEDEQVVATQSNAVNNNKVVVVSYGDVDEKQVKTYYKSFILNFNNYAVRTVYNGSEYSIPAYGYAVIYHE